MLGGGGISAGSVEVEFSTKFDSSGLKKFDKSIDSSTKNLKGFDKSLDKTDKKARQLGKSGSSLGGGLKKAAGAAAAAATAYMGVSQISSAINATTELGKATILLHKNFGLSIKTASQFAAVAKTRGIDITSLGMSFKSLSKEVENAKNGSESSVDAFKRLGISTKDLQKQNLEETLYAIADGMGNLGPGTEKATIMAQLLGRGWSKLGPLIRDGSSSLKENLAMANKYGATFGGKSIESIEDLISVQRELKMMQLGLQVQLTKNLAPSLIKISQGIGKLGREYTKGVGTGGKIKEIIRQLGEVIKAVWPTVKLLAESIGILVKGFLSLPQPIQNIIVVVASLIAVMSKLGIIGAIINYFGGWAIILGKLGLKIKNFALLMRAIPAMMGPVGLALAVLTVAAILIIKNWDKVKVFLAKTWQWIKGAFQTLANFVVSAAQKGFLGPVVWIIANWSKVVNFFRKLPSMIWGGIKRIGSIIIRPFVWAARTIKGIIDSIVGFFTNAISSITSTITGITSTIGGIIGSVGGFLGFADGGVAQPGQIAFVGDSPKPEFVISQTGPRQKNLAILGMAAEALGIPGFADGGVTMKRSVYNKKLKKAKGLRTGLDNQNSLLDQRYQIEQRKAEFDGVVNQNETNRLKKILDSKIKNLRKKRNSFGLSNFERRQIDFEIQELILDKRDLDKNLRDQAGNMAEQISAFNAERFAVLSTFGGNIRSRSGSLVSLTPSQSGGASRGMSTTTNNGGKQITINQEFKERPEDPHVWTRNIQNEVTALI